MPVRSAFPTREAHDRGFTLVELILFLILASIAGTMLYTYSMGLERSVNPAETLRNRLVLQEAMESIVVTYRNEILKDSFDLAGFKAKAENAGLSVTVTATLESGMIQADDPPILKITVSKGGQQLWALFTE